MNEYERLGVTPTSDNGKRTGAEVPWDESSRPRRPESGAEVEYSPQGRLAEEHLVIHDAIEAVDGALVETMQNPGEVERLQAALDLLTDALLSHLSYEEHELVEPLARLGFYAGQV